MYELFEYESNRIRFDSDLNRCDSNPNCPKISNLKESNTNHIIYIPPSESMIYVTLGLQICNVQRKYLFDIRKYVTYFCGSNMLDNMKHCVAMGGAA
ncbi:hypothetical protein ALC53_00133 [Atta colombica]|uniref:Uncharacterized protein n=1 Tax=Atta colombica TaxID=520822 RepID=A0A195BX89_9HYME|nr:hypothetical protein ALC53_00133 [Atta colombica]